MNRYHITLAQDAPVGQKPQHVGFHFENHDDIFAILDRMKSSGYFSDDQEAEQFGIGLKLFSSVMMKHRSDELFKEFEPAFVDFMKKLKGGLKK